MGSLFLFLSDSMFTSSYAEIDENYANFFFYIKAKNKYFSVPCLWKPKYKRASDVKSKANVLQHFKVDPVFKLDATFKEMVGPSGTKNQYDKKLLIKELSICHKSQFSNTYISTTKWCKPLYFNLYIIGLLR